MADFDDNKVFDWEDEIENDGSPFEIIPEGDYPFGVLMVDRGYYDGSAKLPPCKMAVVHLSILPQDFPFHDTPLGQVSVNLFLCQKFEWKLCQFFTAVGLRKPGEKLKMNWNKVAGLTGDCHVGIRKWIGKTDGKEYEANEVTIFYDPDRSPLKAPAMEGVGGANPAGATFTPGQF